MDDIGGTLVCPICGEVGDQPHQVIQVLYYLWHMDSKAFFCHIRLDLTFFDKFRFIMAEWLASAAVPFSGEHIKKQRLQTSAANGVAAVKSLLRIDVVAKSAGTTCA